MTRVGLLFPGEMGAIVGAAAATRSDVVWASEDRSDATARRAEEAGLRDVATVEELVRSSELVLSVCPPAIAEDVARAVAAFGFDGLYVEANAIAPARVERIAGKLAERGIRVVDGSVISSGPVNLYLSGDAVDVAQVAERFTGTEVHALPLDASVGAASALKMAFGGWNKIGAALTAQAHAIAHAYGVEEQLVAEGVDPARFVNSARKAWRWAPEMDEVADTCESLGLPDGLGRGAAALFSRWDAHRDRPAELEQLLADLAADRDGA